MSYEVIPDVHKYFFIPLLPHDASSDALAKFRAILHHGDATSVEAWRALLDKTFAGSTRRGGPDSETKNGRTVVRRTAGTNSLSEPTAFVASDIGGRAFAIHSRENLFELQSAVLEGVVASLPAPTVTVHNVTCSSTPAQGHTGNIMATVSWTAVVGAENYSVHAVAAPPVPTTTASGWQPPYDAFAFAPVATYTTAQADRAHDLESSRILRRSGNDSLSVTLALPCAPATYGGGPLPPSLSSVPLVGVAVTAAGNQLPQINESLAINYLGYHVVPSGTSSVRHATFLWPDRRQSTIDLLAWPGDTRPVQLQNAWPLFSGVPTANLPLAESIAARWDELVAAYEAGDWRNVTGFYSARYCDPNGFTREYVGRSFKWWLSRYTSPFAYYQDRSWSFGSCAGDIKRIVRRGGASSSSGGGGSGGGGGHGDDHGGAHGQDRSTTATNVNSADANISLVTVCMYVQLRGVSVWDEPWDDHGLVRIPRALNKEACITWALEKGDVSTKSSAVAARAVNVWRIVTTSPALPNMAEMLWNARGYAFPHTLIPGTDEAYEPCTPTW